VSIGLIEPHEELPEWLPPHLGATREPGPPDELRLRLEPLGFERAARMLHDAGARFVTMFVAFQPERALVGVFALRGDLVVLRAPSSEDPIRYGGISSWWPAARWAERELCESHLVKPLDVSWERVLTEPQADRLEGPLRGLDVFDLPYGPVRSGVFEAIQFLIQTGGEDVPSIQTRPFFKHRRLEQRFEGMPPERAVHVAERVAGIASVAYATAFSQAVERALGIEAPPRAQRWRAVLAELERMANHLDVIGKEAETTALFVGQARFQILKENVLRLQASLTGSRFARGIVVPGGLRCEPSLDLEALLRALDLFERDLRRDRRLFLGTASMTDRLIGSGHLERATVEQYGAVGPLARGSGISTDARHERPYDDYRRLGLQVVTARDGDAMARITVRFGELTESLRIVRQAIDQLRTKDGGLRVELPAERGEALGWAEAPQGELVIWVELAHGLVQRVKIASPSLRNWALFDLAFPADVLTDFAFIEHSFGLTPAGADR
jgi:formate hydrogenlyase subunit 5